MQRMAEFRIQFTDEGMLIPWAYVHGAKDVEVILADDYLLIQPRSSIASRSVPRAPKATPIDIISTDNTRNPDASTGE